MRICQIVRIVTLGPTASPYLTCKTMYRCQIMKKLHFIGTECLREVFCVDVFAYGADTIEESIP